MSLQDNNDSNEENNQQETSDDDAPPAKRQREVPCWDWRGKPSESFSGYWRIVITDEDNGYVLGDYNVHKLLMAYGERGSDYFARMFETDDTMERQEQCSKIALSKEAAKAFPYLLDFIYQKEIKIEAPELFVYLYSLKEHFQVAAMDDVISQGIFDACKDHDTLILLDKTARDLGIDTANDIIFTPMKTSFVQNVLGERAMLRKFFASFDHLGQTKPIRLEFLLESIKLLDRQELSEARERSKRYVFLLWYIDFTAGNRVKETDGTQFPLQRYQLEEAFGSGTSGIWQFENILPGQAAFLSLFVLYLEGKYCERQKGSLLSESQMAAINQFRRLTSMDGMSSETILSRSAQAGKHKNTVYFLSKIRGDIVARLTCPDFMRVPEPGR